MPKFTTTIRIPLVTESDYQTVSREMEKKQFLPDQKIRKGSRVSEKPFVFTHSGKESLLDLTTVVSRALETTGKKYSFTIMKEKSLSD
jgi:hypothetical protein